jgi:putative membrane protein
MGREMGSATYDPYCGPPPLPGGLWSAWNFDPLLLAALAFMALGAFIWRSRDNGRRLALAAATLVLFAAFVSPLCALSSALFSARVLHHLLIVVIAAPLLALVSLPGGASPPRGSLTVPVLLHAAMLWLWHTPGPYAWALGGHAQYWLMETTLLVSAVWLWRGILAARARPGAAIAALLATMVQMGFLGALLTFAQRPLFAPHFLTTEPFGLSALGDQQLAGLMMWVPGALPYLATAIWLLVGFLGGVPRARERAP